MAGKPLTGYHLYLQAYMVAIVHMPYGIEVATWSLRAEARTIAFLIYFWIAEDFLWFVLNPHFGLHGFRKKRIWWHSTSWWWFMPRDYWVFLPFGTALYVYSTH